MSNEKKLVEEITSMEQDFTQWYTDVVKKAELVDYSPVRGCMIIRPYGYAIWENMQRILDQAFKDTGHENVYMPVFIPESLFLKEKEHIEGFAPEVAWVTHGGDEELTERLVVRPTSETLFCDHYANTIQSYRDLPKLYNQWCSVVRWEKTTRPFLRTTEFLWQEGHTAHADEEDARNETLRMLNVYADFCENALAIPVIKGQKTEKEKFAGAVDTYTIESMMHDGKALQTGTSHYLGTGFAHAFGINYLDKNGERQLVHQTSWGVSTRMMGGLIMVHGDNSGLVVPPIVAPVQVVIIPIAQHKEGVLEAASELKASLSSTFRVKLDETDKRPGWKFSEYEMKGVPVRLEYGPKDIENKQCVLARRDTGEKITVSLDHLEQTLSELLQDIQVSLLEKARKLRDEKTYVAHTLEEMKQIITDTPGFIKAMWCEDRACEEKIKEDSGITSRCIPFEQEKVSDTCVCCGKTAEKMVFWARSY